MSHPPMNPNGRPTALVTGGSKGIGLALAREFARHGHDLVLVARDEGSLNRAAAELRDETGSHVSVQALDLARDEAPAALHDRLRQNGIRVDVLVNNAGSGDYGPFGDSDLDRQLDMLRLNMLSLTALTRLFLPGMLERRKGRILNVASLVACFRGGPQWASYVASKHYVLAFTRGLTGELPGTGVTVTALCPGATATDFVDSSGVGGARVYRWLPKLPVRRVARAGYRGAVRGRTVVVPGIVNKIFAFLGQLPPRAIAQAVFDYLSRGRPPAIR